MTALDRLTGDAEGFVARTWGRRRHLHVGDPDDLGDLLTLDDVDHLATSSAIRTPSIRLVRAGSVLPTSCFTRRASLAGRALTGLVDPRRLLDEFAEGATLVLQGLQRSWQRVTELVADLEHELGHPGQANAYLTPADARGFDLHADSHDVFVVQAHGSKHWEVHDDAGVHQLVLRPGHVLYLPTGTRHAARTTGEASLHLTVGIHPVTWRQVVDRTVTSVLDDLAAADLAEPLPGAWPRDRKAVAALLRTHLDRLAEALAGHDQDAAVTRELERFLTTRPTRVAGGLRDRITLDELADDTPVRRRSTRPLELRPDGERVRVLLGDRTLWVPARARPALEAVLAHGEATFRPGDLAEWLDPTSRVVLVRRLVVEGLLTIEA